MLLAASVVPVAGTLPSIGSPFLWTAFVLAVIVLLVLDLAVFHRHAHVVKSREALGWSVFWISLALLFNVWVWWRFGRVHALEFLAGYLIEKALSVDNLFVFLVTFSYFSVPRESQHRVLFWGILGALVLRALFVVVGAAALSRFHWLILVLGGFLIVTGVRILIQRKEEVHPERNPVVRIFQRFVRMVPEYHGTHFTVLRNGQRYATPLLLVLLVVESTDVVFAVDSIPAIFAVTRDPFIVFTSNIFAILGLRALYFLLAGMADRFHYLKFGLGMVLVFVGAKMFVSEWWHIPIGWSLSVIGALLAGSVAASLIWPPPASSMPFHPPHPGPEFSKSPD